MTSILVVGEDDLTCAMGERMVASLLPSWIAAAPTIKTRGITKLVQNLTRYDRFAENLAHVLCIADSDGQCPAELLENWFPHGRSARFLVRLAVTEAESWALGDRKGVATFFQVPLNVIPRAPDDLPDPKRELLRIASRSRSRQLREEMVSASVENRPGVGYNVHLRRFVQTCWDAAAAAANSPSLGRAMARVRELS